MKVEIQEWYDLGQCAENPHKLYVFGDNMIRVGEGGQASVRKAANSIGIATKRLPTMGANAFFSDKIDEAKTILSDLQNVINTFHTGDYEVIVLPKDGLGTGLAKMPINSPRLFHWLNESISLLFDVEYTPKKK